jgi:hypothetical protein
MPAVFIILAIVVVLTIVIVGRWLAAERRRIVGLWASQRGWHFRDTDTDSMDDMQRDFSVLTTGRSRYALNIADGSWKERDARFFDWHWVTGNGKNTRVHHMSAVLVRSRLPLKPLLIRPENFLDTVADLVGFSDIDFESAEFSRRFFVKAEDRRWAYDVIQPATMDYLMMAPPYSLAMSTGWVLVWDGRRWDPPEMEPALAHACAVLDRMPDFLARQQAGRT